MIWAAGGFRGVYRVLNKRFIKGKALKLYQWIIDSRIMDQQYCIIKRWQHDYFCGTMVKFNAFRANGEVFMAIKPVSPGFSRDPSFRYHHTVASDNASTFSNRLSNDPASDPSELLPVKSLQRLQKSMNKELYGDTERYIINLLELGVSPAELDQLIIRHKDDFYALHVALRIVGDMQSKKKQGLATRQLLSRFKGMLSYNDHLMIDTLVNNRVKHENIQAALERSHVKGMNATEVLMTMFDDLPVYSEPALIKHFRQSSKENSALIDEAKRVGGIGSYVIAEVMNADEPVASQAQDIRALLNEVNNIKSIKLYAAEPEKYLRVISERLVSEFNIRGKLAEWVHHAIANGFFPHQMRHIFKEYNQALALLTHKVDVLPVLSKEDWQSHMQSVQPKDMPSSYLHRANGYLSDMRFLIPSAYQRDYYSDVTTAEFAGYMQQAQAKTVYQIQQLMKKGMPITSDDIFDLYQIPHLTRGYVAHLHNTEDWPLFLMPSYSQGAFDMMKSEVVDPFIRSADLHLHRHQLETLKGGTYDRGHDTYQGLKHFNVRDALVTDFIYNDPDHRHFLYARAQETERLLSQMEKHHQSMTLTDDDGKSHEVPLSGIVKVLPLKSMVLVSITSWFILEGLVNKEQI